MLFTAEHEEPRRSLQKFIAAEINPHVDEWEAAGQFPTHELFKKLGDLGFLGLNKPVEFGGVGLDYSYALMMAEESAACIAAPFRWRSASTRIWRRPLSPASARTPCAGSFSRPRFPATWSPASACPNPGPAPMSPRSKRTRDRTATITSSMAARCGSPMALRRIGCASSPIPVTDPNIATSR